MAKGGFPGFGGGGAGNMQNLIKQAQKMQKDLEKAKEELSDMKTTVSVGGNAIVIDIDGNKKVLSVTLKPEVVDPEDVEMLQDLIVAAMNEAISKAQAMADSKLSSATGGLGDMGGLGGLF